MLDAPQHDGRDFAHYNGRMNQVLCPGPLPARIEAVESHDLDSDPFLVRGDALTVVSACAPSREVLLLEEPPTVSAVGHSTAKPAMVPRFMCVFVMTVTLAACERASPPDALVEPRHVIFLSLDTLRRDRVIGLDRGEDEVMPFLTELAQRSLVFENATTPISFTLPSHMSMMTGLYPDVHDTRRKSTRLDPSIPTLAEELRKAGFRTVGLRSSSWIDGKFGFDRGFDVFEKAGRPIEMAPDLVKRALELLPEWSSEGPRTFLFVHFFDPHSDFEALQGNELPYYAPADVLRDRAIGASPGEFCVEERRCATEFLMSLNGSKSELAPDALRKIINLYDAGLAALDRELARFFVELERRGFLSDSLILLLSDHGEEFREHGQFLHSQMFRECVEIPLILRLPGGTPLGRRMDIVQTPDVMPTVLRALKLPVPKHVQGRDMLGPEDGESDRMAFFTDRDRESRFGISDGSWKLYHDFDGGAHQLFDLHADRGEETDVADQEPVKVKELLEDLREMVRRHRALKRRLVESSKGEPFTEAESKELRSLGYL